MRSTSKSALRAACCLSVVAMVAASLHGASDNEAHGLIPDDGQDDTPALRAFLQQAQALPVSVLRLPAGRYDFYLPAEERGRRGAAIAPARDLRDVTILGTGARLIVHDTASLFSFFGGKNIRLEGLEIDWASPPHASVRIAKVEKNHVILELVSPEPVPDNLPVEGWLAWDSRARRPAPRQPERYWPALEAPRLKKVGERFYRLPLTGHPYPLDFKTLRVGQEAVLRFKIYGFAAFAFVFTQDVTVRDCIVRTAPGMALTGWFAENILIERFYVRPAKGRWMSTAADALHFNECRGTLTVRDSELEAMGDDGLNVRSTLLRVQEVLNERSIRLVRGKDPGVAPDRPRIGDTIGLAPPERALDIVPGGVVVRAERDTKNPTLDVGLDRPLPAWAGADTTFVNLSASPRVQLSNIVVRRNRARGFLLQVPDVVVEHCRFEGQSGAAILLTADRGRWWEGPHARAVRIDSCLFIGGNDGPGHDAGLITSKSLERIGRPAGYPVHTDVTVSRSRFTSYKGPALGLASISDVTIDRCLFGGLISTAPPPIGLRWTNNFQSHVTTTHLRTGTRTKRFRHSPVLSWPINGASAP